MGVWVAEPMMIQNLQQFCFFERSDCLPRLVVIHKDDLEPRRVENIALACNAEIKSIFIHDPIIIIFIAQDAVEKITDMSIGRKFGNVWYLPRPCMARTSSRAPWYRRAVGRASL